jgi:unsaturated chondroitin disaccharide hydrolase
MQAMIDRLESRRLLSAALILSPASGNNTFYLRENTDQLHIDIWQNSSTPGSGTPTQSVLISNTSNIIVNGGPGNDILTQATPLPVPIVFNGGAGSDTLNIHAGTYTIAPNIPGEPVSATSNLTINDAGSLFFTAGALGSGINPIHLAALNILPGGSAVVDTPESANDRLVLVLNSLSVASTGLLDLTANDMIIHNGNLSSLTSLIAEGYNAAGTTWEGSAGITSSFAAHDSSHLTSLGIIQNIAGGTTLYNTFDGQASTSSDVLVKYTFVGDANLDGSVDGSDYSLIDSGDLIAATGWANGDFNYDTAVNGSDYTLLDNTYNSHPTLSSPITYQLNNALNVAQEQSQKTVANLGTTGEYPQYVNADGSLSLVPDTHWTVGTWPGLLWQLYQATGNVYYKNEATAFTTPLSVDDTQTSDVGFRIYDSFYPLLQQEPGNQTVINILLAAAAAKSTTFNSTVGAFEAWRASTSGNPAANFNVLMDLIMDSQLLFWAARQSGNQTYYNEAVANATIEENYLVHADGTSSQFAYFNSSNGQFIDNETYQGYSNTSTWARGEAWAIYGFAQVYSNTGRTDFLATSEKAANWFIAHLPSDNVPYWDFSDPAIPNTYRDTSAAAIAASGLLQLSKLIATSDPVNSAKYRTAAGAILQSLASTTYLANPATADNGVLLQGALNVPANPSIADNSIDFSDYYFVEAVNEYLSIS